MEKWKAVVGYEGLYEVSTLGRVRSLPKRTRKGTRILKASGKDYDMIDLCKNGSIKKHLVHRLVAGAFLPNDNRPQVNHKNGNKKDNRLVNLEWCTRSENQKHAIRIGLRTTVGEKNSQCKLSEKDVKFIRLWRRKTAPSKLAKMFNVSPATICDIVSKRSWSHI